MAADIMLMIYKKQSSLSFKVKIVFPFSLTIYYN